MLDNKQHCLKHTENLSAYNSTKTLHWSYTRENSHSICSCVFFSLGACTTVSYACLKQCSIPPHFTFLQYVDAGAMITKWKHYMPFICPHWNKQCLMFWEKIQEKHMHIKYRRPGHVNICQHMVTVQRTAAASIQYSLLSPLPCDLWTLHDNKLYQSCYPWVWLVFREISHPATHYCLQKGFCLLAIISQERRDSQLRKSKLVLECSTQQTLQCKPKFSFTVYANVRCSLKCVNITTLS